MSANFKPIPSTTQSNSASPAWPTSARLTNRKTSPPCAPSPPKSPKSCAQSQPPPARVRDDWGQDGFEVTLKVDPDRANIAGVSNQDVAQSSSAALSGTSVTTLRRGDQQIPVVSRPRARERASLSDLSSLYVYSSSSNNKVPLLEVSRIENILHTLRIRHLEHFRTISVQSFTRSNVLPSDVL